MRCSGLVWLQAGAVLSHSLVTAVPLKLFGAGRGAMVGHNFVHKEALAACAELSWWAD